METTADLWTILRTLQDRQDILDCLHRYCRGIDRGDRELLLSVYHPDAIDDHGVFVGVAADFVAWALAYHGEHQAGHQHALLNHSCELHGDTAHAETYFLYQGTDKIGPGTVAGGRYIDRLERREGRWGIAARVCVTEWVAELGKDPLPADFRAALMGNCTSSRDPADISYMRPLRVTRPLTAPKVQTQVDNKQAGVFVSARTIPAPTTVSAEAQAFLSHPPDLAEGQVQPDPSDKAAWRVYVEQVNRTLTQMMAAAAQAHPVDILTHQLSRTPLYEVIPKSLSSAPEPHAIFYVHGGAYLHGSGLAAAYMAAPLANLCQMRAFSIDYRMPPDHPFPAGLEDTVDAYRRVLEQYRPENIAVVGGSAGGGLAAAFLLKARDIGLPLPAACVLATPEADLTESGDTFETNAIIDVVLKRRLTESIALYANGHDLRDPHLSPLFGDFTKGFPPTILTSGTRDMFLSNTVRMHRTLLRAGIEAELHVWEAMPHAGFFGAPEDEEVFAEHVRFIKKKLTR